MPKKIFYLSVFIGLGFIALHIPFTNIIGAEQQFTLFDFFAPTIGAFLASAWGAVAVISVKVIDALVTNQTLDTATVIRFFPLALAALYFGARRWRAVVAIIPLVAMALFVLHPEGRQAWYYSLYWLLPMIAVFAPRSLALRSIGSTFTAHAIGSITFLYAFNLPAAVWIGLIPIVFVERMLFAAGMMASYIAFNTVLARIANQLRITSLQRLVRPEYTLSKKLLARL